MRLSDFDFELPEDLIATRPVRPRPAARMLVAAGGAISDAHVRDLPELLQPGDLLVLNTTRVIPARLTGTRWRESAQGRVSAKVEVTLTEPMAEPGCWRALAKPLRKLGLGETVVFSDALSAEVIARGEGDLGLRFNLDGAALQAGFEDAGQMPLPPYIAAKRAPDAQDFEDYQTVFAKELGSVAAPTASLHFDDGLLAKLAARGAGFAHVTLHVGAGTFLPVRHDDISRHKMHAEWGQIDAQAASAINAARAAGGRVIAVGTTALRLIETAAGPDGQIAPWSGKTDIFITPGYEFRVANGLMTNFHLPKSTLLMLVSALMGHDRIREIYAHAIAARYRFFSYGDASLLIPVRGNGDKRA